MNFIWRHSTIILAVRFRAPGSDFPLQHSSVLAHNLLEILYCSYLGLSNNSPSNIQVGSSVIKEVPALLALVPFIYMLLCIPVQSTRLLTLVTNGQYSPADAPGLQYDGKLQDCQDHSVLWRLWASSSSRRGEKDDQGNGFWFYSRMLTWRWYPTFPRGTLEVFPNTGEGKVSSSSNLSALSDHPAVLATALRTILEIIFLSEPTEMTRTPMYMSTSGLRLSWEALAKANNLEMRNWKCEIIY